MYQIFTQQTLITSIIEFKNLVHYIGEHESKREITLEFYVASSNAKNSINKHISITRLETWPRFRPVSLSLPLIVLKITCNKCDNQNFYVV